MRLHDLLPALSPLSVQGPLDRAVRAISHDSRAVGPEDIFVAIQGERQDGRAYAANLNCAAVIADGPCSVAPGVTLILVPHARRALAQGAAALFSAYSLPLVGITGTNGKTTTSFLVESIARAAGLPALLIGTTGNRIAGQNLPASHTTPEAPTTWGLLQQAHSHECKLGIMEVSSIGLAMHRVDGLPFQVAAFTSFSQDHLDFHSSMAEYFSAKLRLFEELLAPNGTAVLFGDDPHIGALPSYGARTLRYGRRPDHQLFLQDIRTDLSGCYARLRTPQGTVDLHTPLLGAHNIENATCALGIGLGLDLPLPLICETLAHTDHVPGRMEAVRGGPADPLILVDYAHSPDALARAISTIKALGNPRLHLVFGCGGDRDRAKRPLMGAIGAEGADTLLLTSDNPRTEDPQAILAEIAAGIPEGRPFTTEVDRRSAIARAIAGAAPGDVVLLAGKGHETTQTIGHQILPFDDRAVAAQFLRSPR